MQKHKVVAVLQLFRGKICNSIRHLLRILKCNCSCNSNSL